jgi:uncharacterized membrane protein YebE (DUF533 family)
MRRLTLNGRTCIETLALLVTMAWADGRLDDREKAGVRGAADVLNLSKELRERLDAILAKPMDLELLAFDEMPPRDHAFAYVAAAWMSGADDDVDEREEALLDKLGAILGFDGMKKAELERIARDIGRAPKGERKWSDEIVALFKAIPPRLAGESFADDSEIVVE